LSDIFGGILIDSTARQDANVNSQNSGIWKV